MLIKLPFVVFGEIPLQNWPAEHPPRPPAIIDCARPGRKTNPPGLQHCQPQRNTHRCTDLRASDATCLPERI